MLVVAEGVVVMGMMAERWEGCKTGGVGGGTGGLGGNGGVVGGRGGDGGAGGVEGGRAAKQDRRAVVVV